MPSASQVKCLGEIISSMKAKLRMPWATNLLSMSMVKSIECMR